MKADYTLKLYVSLRIFNGDHRQMKADYTLCYFMRRFCSMEITAK